MTAQDQFVRLILRDTDMQAHLPLLWGQAHGNVIEFGVRQGISTTALLAGVERNGGHVYSLDIEDCSAVWAGHPQWTFIQAASTEVEKFPTVAAMRFDLVLIDSDHSYTITYQELETWVPRVKAGGTVLLHDTHRFAGDVLLALNNYCYEHNLQYLVQPGSMGLGVIQAHRSHRLW